MKWSGESFSGLGTRADAWGGSISSLYSGADAISSNPAGLGFTTDGFHVTLDWAPPLSIDPTGILGIESKINDSLMETAEDNSPNGIVASDAVEDAQVTGELDMRGGLKGGALMLGTRLVSVAASFHQPFRIENQMNISGTEFNAAALDDGGDVTHRIFGTLNGNLNLEVVVENSTLGFGAQLIPGRLALGLAVDSFSGDMNFEGTMLPEGIISTLNSEASFNDTARPHYDSLYAVVKGDWEGRTFRARAGFAYHLKPNMSLDAIFVAPFNLGLTGPFSMVHNNVRAFNLGAGPGEDVLDVEKLVEDNLTKTEKRITSVSDFALNVPGQAALGFSAKWANYVGSIVLIQYFGNLGFEFSHVQTDSLGEVLDSGRLHQGLDLGTAIRVGIGVEPLILGLGVLFSETFNREYDAGKLKKNTRDNLFIPFVSLGGGIQIGSRFRLDYTVSPYNSSFLRFSTSYKL
jgi:hypothetical protein